MNIYIFAIRDQQVGGFGTPVFALSAGQAVRNFGDEINRQAEGNIYYMHPDDYELYSLGHFDTETGLFHTHAPESMIPGKNLKK